MTLLFVVVGEFYPSELTSKSSGTKLIAKLSFVLEKGELLIIFKKF